MPLPALRQFESFPAIVNNEKGFIIRDPLGFSNDFFIKEDIAFIIYFFNGVTPMRDLQENFFFRFKKELPKDFVKEIVAFFDQNYLLDNVRFRRKLNSEREKFRNQKTRKPIDSLYKNDEKSMNFFKDLIKEIKRFSPKEIPEKGVISPHIDYFRGKETYIKVYSGVKEIKKRKFILLGTNHTMFKDEFIVANKDFETINGKTSKIDSELLNLLIKEFGEKYFEDMIAHKYEHSVELQVNILAELFEDFTFFPILTPSFLDGREHKDFVEWLRKSIDDEYFIIAASDFSHTGIQFGDPFPAIEKRDEIISYDKNMIDLILQKGEEAFINELISNGNKTNICGMGPIYTILKLMGNKKGRIVDYRFTIDDTGGSMVSFAGIFF